MTPDWAEANCAGHSHNPINNPDAWYPTNGQPTITVTQLCATCPIRNDCLNWALHHEAHGYFAGTTEEDRWQIRRTANILLRRPEMGGHIEPVVQLAPECGSMAAVHRHNRLGEPLDPQCATAARYATRKATKRAQQKRENTA